VSGTKDLNDVAQETGELDLDAITTPIETPPAPESEAEAVQGFGRLDSFLGEAIARSVRRNKGQEKPAPTGWPKLDEALNGGLWPGLSVLVGNSGTGKTQFALQMALSAARKKIPALYVGLELDRLGFASRLMALDYRIRTKLKMQWSDIYVGRQREPDEFTPLLTDVFKVARHHLAEIPFYFEHSGPKGWPVSNLEKRVEQLRKNHPKGNSPYPPLVVLDFLQIIGQEPGEKAELRERIGAASYAGKALATKHDVAVLLVSSTSREHYSKLVGFSRSRSGKKEFIDGWPTSLSFDELKGTGKESGEIEYSADANLVMCQEEPGEPVHIAIAKQRAGVPSWVTMDFDGCMFTNDRATETAKKEEEDGGDSGLF